ncbi:MAG: transposase [Thiohalocapsa sp.]
MDGPQWAEHEFGGARLGDTRLSRRLVDSARLQAEKPGCAFSAAAAGERAMVNAYYRMIDHPDLDAVTLDAILAPHRERTWCALENH